MTNLLAFKKDKFNKWTAKSNNTPFFKKNHNGEDKMRYELSIENEVKIGGQNKTSDITIPEDMIKEFVWLISSGKISIKDMTNDNCRLGVDCCYLFNIIKRRVLSNLCVWCEEYEDKCELAKKYYNRLNQKHGTASHTIFVGIDRGEVSKQNYINLCNILHDLINDIINFNNGNNLEYISLKSEFISIIFKELNNKSFKQSMDDCVRQEAICKTLIIVDKNKGWLVVGDIKKLTCTRITQQSPRIDYDFN